jgi:ribonuclease D
LHSIATTAAAADEMAARLASQSAIGLDTEFLRERTYRAQLCLLQVSAPGWAACLDPIAVPDLSALAQVLGDASVSKVLHASRQDLEVLLPIAGMVRPVFDTQIAAALAGEAAQIGYGELVRRLLGHELPKAHTRTDWSRRPLSPEQIEYALDDVRYLLPLKDALTERLERLGRLDWLAEELAALDDASSLGVRPEDAWRRLKGLAGLDPGRERLLRLLAAWRERRAMERDRPRGWILEDALLREIVLRVPRTPQALAAVPDMPPGLVTHCAAQLLECVREAAVADPPPPPPGRARPDPLKGALLKKLGALNQAAASELGLSPEVLVTRRELEQLADGRRDVPVLCGWRRGVIGERLLAAL